MLTDLLRAPITDLAGGKAWVDEIERAGLMFHFEDAADDIINATTGARIFTDDEAEIVRERVRELYALDWGVHGDALGYHADTTSPGWRGDDEALPPDFKGFD